MNKRHWNTIIIGVGVPEDELTRQIANSYHQHKEDEHVLNHYRKPEQ
jgi:predicted DNA-binding protein (MmcQ/YjbR family)